MRDRTHRTTKRGALLAVLALVSAFAFGLGAAPTASAAPPGPTLSLTDLQTLIDANGGSVDGYFLTVVSGTTIDSIPAVVTSIVPDQTIDGSLIFFQASGPVITQAGGIAQGMSGSPLYVYTDQVHDTSPALVGAVAYGSIFTANGYGLATPIDYMSAIESKYFGGAVTLSRTVRTATGAAKRVVIARSTAAARRIKVDGRTIVMRPLSLVEIGGLSLASKAYKDAAARLEKMGFTVAPGGAGSGGLGGADPPPDLVGGASVGVLLARGDAWMDGLGTVTYADGSTVVAFGHPYGWLGASDYYMTNATVYGIYGDLMTPYKLGTPTTLRGAILQDRNSGIAGTLGTYPAEALITSQFTLLPGSSTASALTEMPQWLLDNSSPQQSLGFSGLAADAAVFPVEKLTDSAAFAGSAATRTKIEVSDGSHDYWVDYSNLWDDPMDVGFASGQDIAWALGQLTANADGIAPVTVESVDLTATVSPARRTATVADVQVVGGLHAGVNHLEVTLLVYGQRTPVIVPVTLTIPKGMPLDRTLRVYDVYADSGYGPSGPGGSSGSSPVKRALTGLGFTDPRPTVADIVAAINAAPKNSDLLVSYGANPGGAPSTNPAGITASVPTDWVLTGEVDKTRATMRLRASENTVGPGGGVMLIGMVFPVADAGTLTLFERPAGAHADVRIGTVSGEFDGMATVTFAHWIGGLTHNTRIIASWPGDDPSLSSPSLNATAYTVVEVRSRVDCAAALVGPGDRVRLVARVSPVAAGATVWFERRVGKHWVLIRTATESKGGSAIANWVAPKGVLWLRARVAATAVNAAAWSIPGKLTVK